LGIVDVGVVDPGVLEFDVEVSDEELVLVERIDSDRDRRAPCPRLSLIRQP